MKRAAIVVGVVVIAAAIGWMCSDDAPNTAHEIATMPVSAPHRAPVEPITGSIAGTITCAGAPIAGARVCGLATSDTLATERVREPRCTLTDAAGRYALADLPPARYRVGAMAAGLRPASYPVASPLDRFTLAAGERRGGVDLELEPGGVAVTGAVTDVGGGAIAHARVSAGDSSVDAGADGRFTIWVEPGLAVVTADADGYAPGDAWARAPGHADVVLVPESSLAGAVVDAATRAPVAGVRVSVATTVFPDNAVAITDDTGAFHVDKLAPGRYVAIATEAHGYGRTTTQLVGLGQHVEGVVVELHPAAQVRGRIAIGEAPCPDGALTLSDAGRNRFVRAVRDPDGTVHADGVLPGVYTPRPSCAGHAPHDHYDPIGVTTVDITGLIWQFEDGATIAGRVTSSRGEPIAGASVGVLARMGSVEATTDRDGSYTLPGLRAGPYVVMVTTDRGIADPAGYHVDVPERGRATRDIVLAESGAIDGAVVAQTGEPIADVDVFARGVDPRAFGAGKTDPSGAFAIDNLRSGDYRVTAQHGFTEVLKAPSTSDDTKQGTMASVRAGERASVRIVVESQTGAIRGTVVDVAGQPVTDAFISAVRESEAAGAHPSAIAIARWSQTGRPVLTGTDGTFAVEHLAHGSYTIWAQRKGGGEAFAEHVPVDTTARLQLAAVGSIQGRVTRADGSIPTELAIVATDTTRGFARSENPFATDGRYAIRDLPAGHYALAIQTDGGRAHVDVELAAGEARTGVDVTLQGSLVLTGRVVELGTGATVAGIRMSAREGGAGSDSATGADGRFRIANVPPGKVMLFGMPSDPDSDYAWLTAVRTVDRDGDVGDLEILRNRVKHDEPIGDLGVHWDKQPSDVQEDQLVYEVSWLDPRGPAARAGLALGDVVTSVDGVDITGANASRAFTLLRVPVGANIRLGLSRGTTVTITTAAP